MSELNEVEVSCLINKSNIVEYVVSGWLTDDDNEEGFTIATVRVNVLKGVYSDDEKVREGIRKAIRKVLEGFEG